MKCSSRSKNELDALGVVKFFEKVFEIRKLGGRVFCGQQLSSAGTASQVTLLASLYALIIA